MVLFFPCHCGGGHGSVAQFAEGEAGKEVLGVVADRQVCANNLIAPLFWYAVICRASGQRSSPDKKLLTGESLQYIWTLTIWKVYLCFGCNFLLAIKPFVVPVKTTSQGYYCWVFLDWRHSCPAHFLNFQLNFVALLFLYTVASWLVMLLTYGCDLGKDWKIFKTWNKSNSLYSTVHSKSEWVHLLSPWPRQSTQIPSQGK